jgi:monolysocardiolipin acyltransferase
MFQAGLAAAEERLLAGDWVHIFPEGTRSRDGKMGPVRKGVGRLVAACSEAAPVIIPFVHSGMEEVLPKGSLLPKANQQVSLSGSHEKASCGH